jgi:hypothetical protein
VYRVTLSIPPKRIHQTAHHSPPSCLPLLRSSSISLHARSPPSLALHPPPQTVVPLLLLRSAHKPRGQSPSRRPGQNLPPVREPDDPTHASRDRGSGQLRESELHGEEIGGCFRRKHEAVLLRRGRAREAVFVDVGHGRMILGQ